MMVMVVRKILSEVGICDFSSIMILIVKVMLVVVGMV